MRLFFFLLLVFSSFSFANSCKYKLVKVSPSNLKMIIKKIEGNGLLTDYLKFYENPLVASLLWYGSASSDQGLRKKVIDVHLKNKNWYKPSAEIVFSEIFSGNLESEAKKTQYLEELYEIWPFVKLALAISTLKNSNNADSLYESNDILSQLLMKPDPYVLYYLGGVNKKLGNVEASNSYFISALEEGNFEAFPEVIRMHENLSSCEEYHNIYSKINKIIHTVK